jgi:NitT/TauT family transport system ATP-binding protein
MAAPLIEASDVGMRFVSGDRQIDVLEGVSFAVAQGEFVALVGPSGCGKSTLLNIAAGFLVASRGEVRIAGERVRRPDRRRLYIFQENGVFPWLTVAENIAFGLGDAAAAERRRLVAHYTAMVGLQGFEHSYPRQLSGGMKQRVELARALAGNPDVLFMDEPFGALDYLTRLRMRAELAQIWERETKTVLFVTHDVDEAVQLADRVLVLSARPGRLRATVPISATLRAELRAGWSRGELFPTAVDDPLYREHRERVFSQMDLGAPSTTPELAYRSA